MNKIISKIGLFGSSSEIQNIRMSLDPDFSPDEQEEKARLISQVILHILHISTIFCPNVSFHSPPAMCVPLQLGKKSEMKSIILTVSKILSFEGGVKYIKVWLYNGILFIRCLNCKTHLTTSHTEWTRYNCFLICDINLNPHQVKEENLKLKSENGVLGQYIENLMQVQEG